MTIPRRGHPRRDTKMGSAPRGTPVGFRHMGGHHRPHRPPGTTRSRLLPPLLSRGGGTHGDAVPPRQRGGGAVASRRWHGGGMAVAAAALTKASPQGGGGGTSPGRTPPPRAAGAPRWAKGTRYVTVWGSAGGSSPVPPRCVFGQWRGGGRGGGQQEQPGGAPPPPSPFPLPQARRGPGGAWGVPALRAAPLIPQVVPVGGER